MTAGDILDYAYTGAAQTVVLPPGRYRLECWGAQGGYRSNTAYGGKGGYSVGELTLNEETTLYVQVGGSGNTGKTSGAYNADGDSDPATVTASTLEGFAFRTITFSEAVFSVNPCDINAKTVLSLLAAETVLILEPEVWYSGDLYSGEV